MKIYEGKRAIIGIVQFYGPKELSNGFIGALLLGWKPYLQCIEVWSRFPYIAVSWAKR